MSEMETDSETVIWFVLLGSIWGITSLREWKRKAEGGDEPHRKSQPISGSSGLWMGLESSARLAQRLWACVSLQPPVIGCRMGERVTKPGVGQLIFSSGM